MLEVNISVGELLDKMSILEIKSIKISNPQKQKNIKKEYDLLNEKAQIIKEGYEEKFEELYKKLIKINSQLWDIEDEIRILEKNKDFGKNFIELARSVYFTNDERFDIKSEINNYFLSDIVEEKDYKEYK
tara:strand:+ start:255 stop:644 length:390 start_codon:yes stop_codon:yes gene_type:complete